LRKLAAKLRAEDVYAQIYLEDAKLGKKFNYADKLGIPYVAVIGEEEKSSGMYTLRNMKTGEQTRLSIEGVIQKLREIH